MEDKKIPLLTAQDVDCRIQQITGNDQRGYGAILLLYKNARVDMKILDEVFGATNWQREHEMINGQLFCSVLIWDDDKKQWIKKQDVGTESQTEAEKGRASDSFKRACFNVGIGRELYNAPFIYIKLDKSEVKMNSKGKPTTYTRFTVNEMQYDKEKEAFVRLVITDEKGKTRYKLGEVVAPPEAEKPVQKAENKYVRIENNETYVLTRQGYKKPSELNLSTLQQMYSNKLYQEAQFVIQLAINDKEAEQPA